MAKYLKVYVDMDEIKTDIVQNGLTLGELYDELIGYKSLDEIITIYFRAFNILFPATFGERLLSCIDNETDEISIESVEKLAPVFVYLVNYIEMLDENGE